MADSADFPRRTVLILGAGGFVGSRLVETLAESVEYRPIAALRRPSPRPRWPGVATITCDATDFGTISEALSSADCVVNCVAGSAKTMTEATTTLCQAARRTPPRRIVHLSSMAVYGQAAGRVQEATSAVPPLNDYARAKQVCEQTVLEYVRDGGDAVILRPGCIHGPGSPQWTSRIARLLLARRIGDLGAAGDGICNLTYIDDLVTAIASALTRTGVGGAVFNIVGRELPTWNEYFVRFARALGATPVQRLSERRIRLESRLIAPALAITQRVARLGRLPITVPEPITPSLARLWRQEITLDASAAAARLDLPHTPLDRALDASVRWLRASAAAPASRDGTQHDQTMELGRR